MNDLSLLPGNPERFFGLEKGYDRRDLKRAYGKAIRIYKPESHPAEFGSVRDAYERLERVLRYGKQQQTLNDSADVWRGSSATRPAENVRPPDASSLRGDQRQATSTQPAGAEPLPLRTLAVVDPVAAMRRFETMSRRTPPDFYLAAVLADANAGKPTARYLGYLLDGLAVYPSDPGLLNLATEFLRTEVPDLMLVKIVRFVAEKLRAPSFYMLTETLWLRLVEQLPFDEWEPLLKTCEREIRQTEPTTRTVFYLRLLRSAIWVAPPDWVDSVIGTIESESVGLHQAADAELEFLAQVRQVLRTQLTSRWANQVRDELLHAARLSCQSDTPTATAEVLKLLNQLARDGSRVRDAFPMSSAENDGAWVMIVYAVVEQYLAVLDETENTDAAQVSSQVQRLVGDLRSTLEPINQSFTSAKSKYRTLPLVIWMIGGTIGGSLPLIVFATAIFGGSGPSGAIVSVVGIALLLVGTFVSFVRWIYPKYFHDRMLKSQRESIHQAYSKHWRSRLFRYFSSTSEPIQAMLHRIDAMERRTGQAVLGNIVEHFVRQDAGLCVFAALQALLR